MMYIVQNLLGSLWQFKLGGLIRFWQLQFTSLKFFYLLQALSTKAMLWTDQLLFVVIGDNTIATCTPANGSEPNNQPEQAFLSFPLFYNISYS